MHNLCEFLIHKQNGDGGWGEDFNACVKQEWVDNREGSQIVNTSWAMMALIAAGGGRYVHQIHRAAKFVMSRQLCNGDWPQERISGVFNGNIAIHYPGYKNSMPVWALGRYVSWCRDLEKTV
jgi:lanosterol synthase